MNCTRYRELISARRDGEITPDELAELEGHLQDCPDCRSFAGELENLGEALADRPREQLPEMIEQRILSDTIGAKAPAAPRPAGFLRGYYRVPRGLAWAGILALVVLVFFQILAPFSKESRKGTPTPIIDQSSQHIVLSQRDIVYTHSFHEPSDNSNGGD
jgi:anti-sigma factor RsiW